MSHIASLPARAGQPWIVSLEAVQLAAQSLGLEIHQRATYKWFGRHVGDYPLPAGWTADEMGRNAVMVLRPSRERCQELGIDPEQVYELAVVPDKNNPGAYTLMYDHWHGGYGLDKVIGSPVFDQNYQLVALAPRFMQHYWMALDAITAAQQGDFITFYQQADGSWISVTEVNQNRLRV